MDDLISRQAAIEIVRNRVKRFTTACVLAVTEIEKLPSAQPERKKGKWIECEEDWRHQIVWWRCSECNYNVSAHYNFCPNCGADMRGE